MVASMRPGSLGHVGYVKVRFFDVGTQIVGVGFVYAGKNRIGQALLTECRPLLTHEAWKSYEGSSGSASPVHSGNDSGS